MAEYRTIRMAFWSDPFIEALEATAKLLYVYLFTCQNTNNLGLLEITRKKIAFETGIPEESVNRHIETFEASGKVVTDGAFIWLVTFIKNQCTTSPKLVSSLQGMIPSVSSIKIRNEILRYYPRLLSTPVKSNETQYSLPLPHAIDTLSIPSGEQEREEEREKEREERESEIDSPPPPPCLTIPPACLEFAEQFQEAVTERYGDLAPKATPKLLRKGAIELDKAQRLDGFEMKEIKAALLWSVNDRFWGQNVRSLANVRERMKNGMTKLQGVISDYRKSNRHGGEAKGFQDILTAWANS